MQKIKVMIADDHPAFREGLSVLLQRENDLEVVAISEDGEETVRLATELNPDVAIIDAAMPRLNGIEATKQIKAACPRTAILIISAYDDESYMVGGLEAGAAGYLSKTVPLHNMVNAIRLVCNGEAVLELSSIRKILNQIASAKVKSTRNLEALHSRELQILRLAGKGRSNKEIAAELVISPRTVQSHFKNIFGKLEVGSRTEAVIHALGKGWLKLDEIS